MGLSLAAAVLVSATVASAAPMHPALPGIPFTQITESAARAALQTPFCPQVGLVCYYPAHLKQAYDFPNGRGGPTGAGQTIVIVEAYGSPTIERDLAQFDAENGLPEPPSFVVMTQQTPVSTAGSGDTFTWAVETSLDVEYAHAMAPGANIVLAIAATDDTANMVEIEREVLPQYPGAIVSQSFGMDETGDASDPVAVTALQSLYLRQVASGGTVLASSGDFGASNFTPFVGVPTAMAGYPASSPYVLAVGGTEGNPYPDGLLTSSGRYGGEQVWNEIAPTLPFGAGASGGAPSVVFPAPPWQTGLTGSVMRAEPDVSYNAAADGGVVVVLGGHHGVVGGTSAAAPQWAGIVALANELRGKQGRQPLGLATPQLYALASDSKSYSQDFHDVTIGDNALFGAGSGLPGFSAGPGYDIPTGLGTPVVSRLLKDLAGPDALGLRLDDLLGPGGGKESVRHVRLRPGG